MFERIKDFFYDISDVVVSLLIIALIFVSVSWKINDTLSVNIDSAQSPSQDVPPIVVEPISPPDEVPDEQHSVTPSVEEPVENETPPVDPPGETAEETPPEPPAVEEPVVLETFVVAEGSTGYDIGVELQSAGFITNVNDFVKRSIEMGLDNKLRSGTFKLSKSDSLDLIIKILTGEKRP